MRSRFKISAEQEQKNCPLITKLVNDRITSELENQSWHYYSFRVIEITFSFITWPIHDWFVIKMSGDNQVIHFYKKIKFSTPLFIINFNHFNFSIISNLPLHHLSDNFEMQWARLNLISNEDSYLRLSLIDNLCYNYC